MMFISGAGPPRGILSDEMWLAGEFLPLTHVILVIQGPWLGIGWDTTASLLVAAFTVGATVLGLRFFRWE
jgi:hypothetical protein